MPQRTCVDRVDARRVLDERRCRRGRRVRNPREAAGDERAVARARVQIALGDEALERIERRLARHAELLREIALRRQPRSGPELAGAYQCADLVGDLAIETAGFDALERHGARTGKRRLAGAARLVKWSDQSS